MEAVIAIATIAHIVGTIVTGAWIFVCTPDVAIWKRAAFILVCAAAWPFFWIGLAVADLAIAAVERGFGD